MPRKIDPSNIVVGTGLAGNDSVENNAIVDANTSSGLSSHVTGENAHEATDVSIDDSPPLYDSKNVEGALDELAALIPPRPPELGLTSSLLSYTGVSDWGAYKLRDSSLTSRGLVPSNVDPSEIYPYYYVSPESADDFSTPGDDPVTDSTFNVADGGYVGGGEGQTHAGAFTRAGALEQTNRIAPYTGALENVVLSGSVYPADRGVLALLYFPVDATLVTFAAQSLDIKCRGAILLGQGISDGCDGDSGGGMFSRGETGGAYDPFAFPGQASGQYNLQEIHSGTSSTGGPAPVANDAAGQVRLGTDPLAGEPVLTFGLPILGATTSARGSIGNDNNFFRYRLPYMSDYSSDTGLIYTSELEKPRYFSKPTVSLNPGTDLTQAGDYSDFPKDYWQFQVARYRYQFSVSPPGASPVDQGTFVLVHFKKEAYFEELVRDGVAPTDDKIYGANIVDWADIENDTNLIDGSGATSTAYHNLRAKIYRDGAGTTAPTPSVSPQNEFDYSTVVDQVMEVSGVKYFVPRDGSVNGAPSYQIDFMDIEVSNLWANSYRTSDDTTIRDMNPGLLSMSSFSYESPSGTPSLTTVPINALVNNASRIRHQRIELAQEDLFAGVPASGDLASASLAGLVEFAGDETEISFSSDAKPQLFFRRPLGHQTLADTVLPVAGVTIEPADGNRVLYHSSRRELASTPEYGNYFTGAIPLTSLYTANKDSKEYFLDEAYRYHNIFPALAAGNPTKALQITGPGLPAASTPIEIPVRAGTTTDPDFAPDSWLGAAFNERDLANDAAVLTEAQVCGLPERNPPLSDGVKNPFPSSGLLKYPQDNYQIGFRPSFADGDVTAPLDQFDYSGATGERVYVRVFDASFNGTVDSVGSTTVTFRLDGLTLSDISYSAPGPGSDAIALMVKVPGLTTWMDAGRRDFSGPSKQDAVLDGAGCQVVGPDTFNGIDTTNGISYCQIKVNLGPSASLFENSGSADISSAGQVPIMIKVILKDSAAARSLDFNDGNPTISASSVRGLTSIELVPPSN